MDFRQITMMQKIKSGMDRFRANHPKFPLFLRALHIRNYERSADTGNKTFLP